MPIVESDPIPISQPAWLHFLEFDILNRAQIVWLHGKAEQYADRNTPQETDKLDPKRVKLLTPLLHSSPLVVLGYRGAEASIMDHLLGKSAKQTQNFRNGIYWCARSGDAVHPKVEGLQRALGSNFRLLDVHGFDEVMRELSDCLRGEDLYLAPQVGAPQSGAVAFDDKPLVDADASDLDLDLAVSTMRDYCTKLGRAAVTTATLPALLREQGLLVESGGKIIPTVGCLLLFGKNPQTRFPHAVVSATVAGKKRLVFKGNLLAQRTQLLEWLCGPDVNPITRVKKRISHRDGSAFPPRALVELLVNLLVHRDYEVEEPSSIDVAPGAGITFTNPGGLLDSVANRVTVDAQGWFRPIPRISELRNRSLCDVFFGIEAMEREGTGLSDVEQLAFELGGSARFAHEGPSNRFVAEVLQPTASVGSKNTARNDHPVGVYVLNALPFAAVPERLSVIQLRAPLSSMSGHSGPGCSGTRPPLLSGLRTKSCGPPEPNPPA